MKYVKLVLGELVQEVAQLGSVMEINPLQVREGLWRCVMRRGHGGVLRGRGCGGVLWGGAVGVLKEGMYM